MNEEIRVLAEMEREIYETVKNIMDWNCPQEVILTVYKQVSEKL